MKVYAKNVLSMMLVSIVAAMLSGCAAFRQSVTETDPATASPLQGSYDQRDLLAWSDLVSQDLMGDPFFSPTQTKPILVDMGIQNRTMTHMDMKAITDTITTKLLDQGKIRLINNSRRDDLLREQGYQLANCTPETRAAVGRQLGAGFMLTGSLIEIESKSGRQARVSRKQDVYYQLTVEITNLETGEIVVRKQRDRLRRVSKPLIGW